MGNQYLIEYKNIGFTVLATLLLIVTLLAFLTYNSRNLTTSNPLLRFAIANHTWIMVSMIGVSVAFGFFWSNTLYKEIEKKSKSTRSMLDVVLLFLGSDERKILHFLVENNGKTTQAEISRLDRMNKVKAYRSVKKMQEKQIIDIIPHGKVRKIQLKKNILNTLLDKTDQIQDYPKRDS